MCDINANHNLSSFRMYMYVRYKGSTKECPTSKTKSIVAFTEERTQVLTLSALLKYTCRFGMIRCMHLKSILNRFYLFFSAQSTSSVQKVISVFHFCQRSALHVVHPSCSSKIRCHHSQGNKMNCVTFEQFTRDKLSCLTVRSAVLQS